MGEEALEIPKETVAEQPAADEMKPEPAKPCEEAVAPCADDEPKPVIDVHDLGLIRYVFSRRDELRLEEPGATKNELVQKLAEEWSEKTPEEKGEFEAAEEPQSDDKYVIFVTGNKIKVAEAKKIMRARGVDIPNVDLKDLPEEQGDDPAKVVVKKAMLAFDRLRRPVMVEDMGLHFAALNGLPGAHIRAYHDGVPIASIAKLLDGFEDKSAWFKCAICIVWAEGRDIKHELFVGELHGKIVTPRGNGWQSDVIFQPDGLEETLAELGETKKNEISHRRRALEKVLAWAGEDPAHLALFKPLSQ